MRQLTELQPDSGQRLPTSIISGFHNSNGSQLVTPVLKSSGWYKAPKYGAANLLRNLNSRQKLLTIRAASSFPSLNRALKGGTSYPILTAALGTGVGMISGGAGFLFGAFSLGVDLGRRDSDVLARSGDEIWQIEEIGKVRKTGFFSNGGYVAMHLSSYLLVDPYRSNSNTDIKGWLLSEERTEVWLGE